MKTGIAILVGCITLIISTQLLAGCYRDGRFTSCGGCQSGSPYVTECQCTDPGVGRNNCMSAEKYCENFGNVGGYTSP